MLLKVGLRDLWVLYSTQLYLSVLLSWRCGMWGIGSFQCLLPQRVKFGHPFLDLGPHKHTYTHSDNSIHHFPPVIYVLQAQLLCIVQFTACLSVASLPYSQVSSRKAVLCMFLTIIDEYYYISLSPWIVWLLTFCWVKELLQLTSSVISCTKSGHE